MLKRRRAPAPSGSLFRQQLLDWLRDLHVDADRVIDVGSGRQPARTIANVTYREYVTVDNNPARQPDHLLDINVAWDGRLGGFDVAFCLEVMEYVWDPVQAHENVASVLRPGGVAYLSYPFVYPIHQPVADDFLRYTQTGVERLLQHAGLSPVSVVARVATAGRGALEEFVAAEGMWAASPDAVPHIGYLVAARKQ